MKLRLVKQGDFLGVKCDFYVDKDNNIYMSGTQIGYALGYEPPEKVITNIQKRYPGLLKGKTIEVDNGLPHTPQYVVSNRTMILYPEIDIYNIVRKIDPPFAEQYFKWVFDVIQSVKNNGSYISTEKDNKWIGVRKK